MHCWQDDHLLFGVIEFSLSEFNLIIFFECAVWEVGHHHFAGNSTTQLSLLKWIMESSALRVLVFF